MPAQTIKISGARQHNLKNLQVEIPREKLVVITGLSGSGKSSLAFDTLYAEGQRRYVESLSAYARQFLDQMEKPDVDFIEGLSPAIAIEQRSAGANPRSTIATTTEIYDYLRLLFANIGQPHCPETGVPIVPQSTSDIVDKILALPPKTRVMLLAPVVRGMVQIKICSVTVERYADFSTGLENPTCLNLLVAPPLVFSTAQATPCYLSAISNIVRA